jgi:hypothetical protein
MKTSVSFNNKRVVIWKGKHIIRVIQTDGLDPYIVYEKIKAMVDRSPNK